MKAVVIVGVALVAFALVGVVAMVATEDEPAKPKPSATAAAAVPTPDAEQRAAYLQALGEIDPGLVVNENRAIRRGRAICDHILHPQDGGWTLERYTVEELSGGDATIDEAQARKVIAAVKVWCR